MFAIVMVLAAAFALSRMLNKRIYEMLPVAVFTVTLGVYLFALFLPLNVAAWICMGMTVVTLIISLVRGSCPLAGWHPALRTGYPSGRQSLATMASRISNAGYSLKQSSPLRKSLRVCGTRLVASLRPPTQSDRILYATVVCVCVFFSFLVSDHRVFYYDDLSYWGLYTKNIFCINKLPQLFENCSVDYKDYTPIMQILQYLAVFGRKTFSEGTLYQTNVCFIYIMLLPLLSIFTEIEETKESAKSKARLIVKIATVVMYVIFPHILTAQFYYRLGVDLFLALVFGYVLYYIFAYECKPDDRQSECFRVIAITMGLAFLALIKTSGIVLCIMALIMFVIREIYAYKNASVDESVNPTKRMILVKILVASVFTFGSYFSWQLFLHYSWNNGYLSNRVKAGVTGGSFAFPPYTGEVVLNYIKHFFTYPLTRNKVGVTAFVLILFILATQVVICGWPQGCHKASICKKEGPTKWEDSLLRTRGAGFSKRLAPCRISRTKCGMPPGEGTGPADLQIMICTMTGLVVFCLAHLSMYLFVFDEWEAHGLLEFDRYITQYLGGVFFLYVCKLIKSAGKENSNGKSGMGACTIALIISAVIFIVLLPFADMRQYLIHSNYEDSFEKGYGELSRNAQREWDESGIAGLNLAHDGTQKLTVVANAWDETTQFIEYVAVPQPINRIVNTPAMDPETVNGFIMDYVDEYVYVCENAPDSYPGDWNETCDITSDGKQLEGGGLYFTDRSGEDKILVKVKQ